MKILVCGSRTFADYALMRDRLVQFDSTTVLIHGAAKGADSMAGMIGKSLGWVVKEYPADWKNNGKAAGPIRNQQMLDSEPDIEIVLAFHDDPGLGKGTADMVKRSKAAGKTVEVYVEKHH